ncbi:hypothetical protein U1Q18_051510, partial [Sarracenia purpurea var. burkii]
ATKRHLSSRIDRVDCNLDECAEITAATRDEVSELRGEMKLVGVDVQSVHHAVRTLETKISRIEGKQEAPSSSSRPALEMPQMTPLLRIGSLPPIPAVEPPSPSASSSSHKDLQEISEEVGASSTPDVANKVQVTEDAKNGSSNSGLFIRRLGGISASFLTRTRSGVPSFK